MSRPFASSDDHRARVAVREEVAPGVFAFTAEGDPNVGAVVGARSLLCVDARATPRAAGAWLERLREVTDRAVEYLVLTHYHAVRTLGASAFAARHVVAHERTAEWIAERGRADWESELRRFPRLFDGAEEIPGLTVPDVLAGDRLALELGDRRVELVWLGAGHTQGDLAVWLPAERVLFAGDLVEHEAVPYAGDATIGAWSTATLDAVEALDAEVLVPGRGAAVHGAGVAAAVDGTRRYLRTLLSSVEAVRRADGTLIEAARAARAALEPEFGGWAIFEHCLPFNVARAWDEAGGAPPAVWTHERDARLWAQLAG